MGFFKLHTSRDMLEKACREYRRLQAHWDIDNVFNFFVTAYHIQDYVKKTEVVKQSVLEDFLKDQAMMDCRDLCDNGKHLRLTRRPGPSTRIWRGCINGSPVGVLPVNGGDRWVLFSGDREVNVEWLATRVIEKWESFFKEHGL